MVVPPRIVEAVASRVRITGSRRVGGGCISPAARIDTDAGPRFLKWSGGRQPAGLFRAEAEALRAIAATATVRVPVVEAFADDWILMEWLEPGVAGPAAWSEFGRALARLHRAQADRFGWPDSNYIGQLEQSNARDGSWSRFWKSQRIAPQMERAIAAGHFSGSDQRLLKAHLEALDDLLAVGDAEGPSLLHGDLWSGNAHEMAGVVAAIDPSSYYGHREVDLAMAALFGGFPAAFYEGYEAEWPLEPGWQARRAAYQVYHLLVHVNLFGSSYVPAVMESAARVV